VILRDISEADMKSLLKFMYHGEVQVRKHFKYGIYIQIIRDASHVTFWDTHATPFPYPPPRAFSGIRFGKQALPYIYLRILIVSLGHQSQTIM